MVIVLRSPGAPPEGIFFTSTMIVVICISQAPASPFMHVSLKSVRFSSDCGAAETRASCRRSQRRVSVIVLIHSWVLCFVCSEHPPGRCWETCRCDDYVEDQTEHVDPHPAVCCDRVTLSFTMLTMLTRFTMFTRLHQLSGSGSDRNPLYMKHKAALFIFHVLSALQGCDLLLIRVYKLRRTLIRHVEEGKQLLEVP